MYKVISSNFVTNEIGSTIIASFFTDSIQTSVPSTNKKCLVATIINQKDSENEGKVIDQSYTIERLSNELERAKKLCLDVDINIDETAHEVSININGNQIKIQPSEFNFY